MNQITSIIIPSRNEPYLQKTILDLLIRAKGEVEIIVTLDGYWPSPNEIINDPRVSYIHFSEARGMRNAINSAVAIAKGEYIMKLDAHCMVAEGYDEVLKADCEDNWVVVPRRYALDPVAWRITDNPKYPVDYMYLSRELHGVIWGEKNKDPELKKKLVDETCSSQGSTWFMKKEYFNYLELEDEENFGRFASEFQEIGFKCWLSGGKVIVNKKTWSAHWHKDRISGRGYSLNNKEFEIAENYVKRWVNERVWPKQTLPFYTMIERFWPMPTWTKEDLERIKENAKVSVGGN